jgi:hypothetical protein
LLQQDTFEFCTGDIAHVGNSSLAVPTLSAKVELTGGGACESHATHRKPIYGRGSLFHAQLHNDVVT